MKSTLQDRLTEIVSQHLPIPASGRTSERHRILAETAREDVSLAKLAEAHWDAMAILAEAERKPIPDKLYAVWASEIPDKGLQITPSPYGVRLSGSKPFCSGLELVDRALVTVAFPEPRLVEVDLRSHAETVQFDISSWRTDAFRQTQTGAVTFTNTPISLEACVGDAGWYLSRPGFWHGACGPAACWAGGVAGLLDFALASNRNDPHTLAHLGAMQASVWAMYALLDQAGHEMDGNPKDVNEAQARALKLRHIIEQMGTEVLHRFARAYGPYPLAMNDETARRYREADLYMRQSHAERDLETLGRLYSSALP
jgi:hypothetical protein